MENWHVVLNRLTPKQEKLRFMTPKIYVRIYSNRYNAKFPLLKRMKRKNVGYIFKKTGAMSYTVNANTSTLKQKY